MQHYIPLHTVAEQISGKRAGFTVRSAFGEVNFPGLSRAIRVSAAQQGWTDDLDELVEDSFAGLMPVIEAVTVREIRPKVLDEIVQVGLLLGIILTTIYQLSTLKKIVDTSLDDGSGDSFIFNLLSCLHLP